MRVIQLQGRGLRGASVADLARRSGAWGAVPTDSDAGALEKFAQFAIEQNPEFQSTIPGPSNNTRMSLADLKAAQTSDRTSLYDGSLWTWTLANFTGQADDVNIVKADSTTLSNGAWVRTSPPRLEIIYADLYPSLRAAYDALPATGGTIVLGNKRYRSPFITLTGNGSTATANVDYLAKPNVRIIGAGRPQVNATGTRYVDGTGTIIEDMFAAWADNLTIEGVGFDSGADVCAAYHGGAAREALIAGFKPGQVPWDEAASPNKRNLTLRGVGALCADSGAPVHGILIEAYDGVVADDLETVFGTHGTVIKSRFVTASGIRSYGNAGEGVICKANNYAPMYDVNITNVSVRRSAGAGTNDGGRGIQIYSENGPGAGKVRVSNMYAEGKGVAVEFWGDGTVDCQVANLEAEGCDTGVSWRDDVRRCKVRGAIINNCSQAAVTLSANDLSNSLSQATVTNVASNAAVNVFDGGKLTVDAIHFEGVTASGAVCVRVGAGSRARIGRLTAKDGTIFGFTNSTPALVNGYTEVGSGTAPFAVAYLDGRLSFQGCINIGSADTFVVLPHWLRPKFDLYGSVTIYTPGGDITRRFVINAFDDAAPGAVRIIGSATIPIGSFACLDDISFSDALMVA